MAESQVPDGITTEFVNSVVGATMETVSDDDRQWFNDNPDETVRYRDYVHGELSFGPEIDRWLREAEKIRRVSKKQYRQLGYTHDPEVTLMVEVVKVTGSIRVRQVAYVAVTDPSDLVKDGDFGVGVVPPWALGHGGGHRG